ncbi:MAG: hypothetical protein AAB739_04510 [Patescibacteria group bacterium]
MKNINTKIFSRASFFKPCRLVWQEEPEKFLSSRVFPPGMDERKERDMMKSDLREISRPGEKQEDNMTPDAFLEKYKDLLLDDVDLFSEVLDRFSPMGVEAFKKVVEFGDSYLQNNPPATASYIYNVLTQAVYLLGEEGLVNYELYKNNPDLAKQAQEDIKKFVESFVKEKAGHVLDNNAIALAETIRTFAENENLLPQMPKFFEDKIKKFDLSDQEFAAIIIKTVSSPRLPRCYESISQILYQSEDKPLTNIVSFGEAVGWAVLSGDSKLFKFVLQRGRDIVKEKEGQEYVEKAFTDVDKKSPLEKDWKAFLKENAESFDKQELTRRLAELHGGQDGATLAIFLASLKKEYGLEFVRNAILEMLSDGRFSRVEHIKIYEKYLSPEDLANVARSVFADHEKNNCSYGIFQEAVLGKYLKPTEANKIFTDTLKSLFAKGEDGYRDILKYVPSYRAYVAPEVLEKTLKDVLNALENSDLFFLIIKHLKDYHSGISDDGFVKEKVNSALEKASDWTVLENISELKKPEFAKYVTRVDLKRHLERAITKTSDASTLVRFEDGYKDFFSPEELEKLLTPEMKGWIEEEKNKDR